MRTIYKFPIDIASGKVMMHRDAQILRVGVQHEKLCAWALVDTDSPFEEHRFEIVGTGFDLSATKAENHIATVLLDSGWAVLHIFRTP